ncbi:MAG: hypothetical protein ABJL99_24455 [Aliishimia sp.]
MTQSSEETLPTCQRDVQRLLGRSMLQFQQYERLIKVLIACHKLSGNASELERIQTARVSQISRDTLGMLVNTFIGSGFITNNSKLSDEIEANEDVGFQANHVSLHTRTVLEISDAEFAQIEEDLKAFVKLRNNLAHNFINEHDLWNLEGCRSARAALTASSNIIDQRLEQLRGWVEDVAHVRKVMAKILGTDAVVELIPKGQPADTTEPPLGDSVG